MNDGEIVKLIFGNNERGLSELQKKYGALILKVCGRVLRSREDAEQCANDTLQAVWDGIPPGKPDNLSGFVCKVARRISISRLRYNTAAMRSSDLLTELDECIPANYSVEKRAELSELSAALDEWLNSLPGKQRKLFTLRYFYMYTVKEAARLCGMSESAAGTALMRLRDALKDHLIERGMFYE